MATVRDYQNLSGETVHDGDFFAPVVQEVPVGPFRQWLSKRLAAEGVWDPVREETVPAKDREEGLRSMREIGDDWGIHPRTMIRILRGEQKTMAEEKAEEVFVAAGEPYLLEELYPR